MKMSNRGDLLRVRARFGETQAKQEPRLNRFLALMGNGEGDLAVPGRPLFVYVRVQGRGVVECLNQVAALRNDLPIIVGYDFKKPDTLQVLSIYEGGMSSFGPYAYLPAHHQAHEFRNTDGGDDVVWVQSQQILPLLVSPTDPTSMFIGVFGGWYPWDTGWHYFETTVSADLTARVPAVLPADARFVLVSIDGATEALQYTNGNIFPVFLPPADRENMIPAPPAGSIPIAAIYLPFGTTTIEWDNIYDLRLFNQPVGGSVSPGPHALLDVTVHSDTATNTPPARGSLTVANATPAWDELVHPGGAGYALTTDATDVIWDQTPAWTGLHSFGAGIAFTGASDANEITIPDDTAIALELLDAGGLEYLRIVSTDAQPAVIFNLAEEDVDFQVAALGITNALFIDGATGAILVEGPSLTVPAAWNLIVPDNVADAFGLDDGGGLEYMRIVSTDANPYFLIDPAAAGILVGVGIAVPTAFFEVYAPVAAAGLSQFKITDGVTGGYFAIQEGGGGAGVYLPRFYMLSAGINGYGGIISGVMPVARDVLVAGGAAIVLQAYQDDATVITAANLLVVANLGTTVLTIDVAGHVGVGTAPNASAILDLSSTTGALLLPRMTTVQRLALGAVDGMLVYDTDLGVVIAREGGAWADL